MYPGLPSRLEREIKQLYLERVLKGDTEKLTVSLMLIYHFYIHHLVLTKILHVEGASSIVSASAQAKYGCPVHFSCL